jgi:tetratricopeptide (TPR) repeat protein
MPPEISTIKRVPRKVDAIETSRDASDGDELLRLALSRPREALDTAHRWLGGQPSNEAASYALQAAGIAHRQLGDAGQALRDIRRGLRLAQQTGRPDRIADVRATMGATLTLAGRTKEALVVLDTALAGSRGVEAARIRMRRGGVLQILGRYDDALVELRRAIPVLRDAGDSVYEARALTYRALVYLELASHSRSDIDFARGEELFRGAGQQLESAVARHNRGIVAYRSGDLPAALRHLDAAEDSYRDLGQPTAELELDRCRVLLSGGMPDDARHHAGLAVEILARNTSTGQHHAEALLTAASAGLAAGDPVTARTDAEAASRFFRMQHRDRWVLRAQRTALTARWSAGERSVTMMQSAGDIAKQLELLRDPEAIDARLLAGRIALALHRPDDAHVHFEAVSKARHRGAAIARTTGWLARALQAEANGDSRAMLAACRRGLDVLDEHRLSMGATEMRARATVHGVELAALATRHAARIADAKQLLLWSERWRGTALAAAPVRPPDDDELAMELSALRGVTRRIAELRAHGASSVGAERDQAKLEASVRGRMLRTSGTSAVSGTNGTVDVRRIRAALGTTTLVELVEVDGKLLVVTVGLRGTKLREVGSAARAEDELDFARYGLRRAAMSTSSAGRRLAMSSLETNAASLQEALLGQAVEHLGDGEVVIIPSGRLHAVPWSLLPALRDRTVTVAPSVSSWLRAKSTPKPRHDKVALVAGPGLETDGAEVHDVAARYPGANLLTGDDATADNVLAALEGASLAHIAAHGTFRADNALFSSLRLADGELTVHDLERLHHPPHRLVLSSCDSGLGAHAGADELLGLTNALIGLGTAGLLASVVPVNDVATVPLMVAVHGRLREGATLAQALHQARRWLGASDIVVAATGLSFVALGGA